MIAWRSVREAGRRPPRGADDSGLWFAVCALVAVSLALSLWTLARSSIWIDEAFTYAVATAPSRRLFEDLALNGGNMLLYTLLMRGWLTLGDSDWWLRLPSAIFATGAIPLVFAIGRRIMGGRGALLAAMLVAGSSPLIAHAQEGRSYSLAVWLVLVAWLTVLRYAEAPSVRRAGAVVVAASLAVYAHVIVLLVVVAQLVWPVMVTARRQTLLLGAGIAALVSPVVVLALRPGAADPSWIPELSQAQVGSALLTLAGTDSQIMALGMLALWGAGIMVAWRHRDPLRMLAVIWISVPVAALVGVSLAKPILEPRYMLPLVPGAALLAASAVTSRVKLGGLALLPLLVLNVPSIGTALTGEEPEDWRGATAYLAAEADDGDGVLLVGEARPAVAYYWQWLSDPPAVISADGPVSLAVVRRTYSDEVRSLRAANTVRVLTRFGSSSASDRSLRYLAEVQRRLVLVEQRQFGSRVRLDRYQAPDDSDRLRDSPRRAEGA